MPGPARKLTPEQEAEIAERYNVKKESANSIAKKLGIPVTTVRRTIERCGIPRRPDTRIELSAEDRLIAVEDCLSGSSREEVAERFNVSTQTIGRILKDNGVSMSIGPRPTCTLNHTAFDVRTRESDYWEGFLHADGAIVDDGWGATAIAMNLAECDLEHLEKFRTFLGSSHTITRITSKKIVGGPSVFFKVRSKQIATALRARGMIIDGPARTPVGEIANSADFWRGVIDGDGTLSIIPGNYAGIWLYGHRPLLTAYQQWLHHNNLADLKITVKKNGSTLVPAQIQIFQVSASGSTALRIIERLYADAPTALSRKLNQARTIMQTCR